MGETVGASGMKVSVGEAVAVGARIGEAVPVCPGVESEAAAGNVAGGWLVQAAARAISSAANTAA